MRITENPRLVTVFGGSGFVGRHLVRALAGRGYRVLVAVRRPDLAGHLQPMGNVGQIRAIQANLRFPWSVERAVESADVVVNLVAILAEGGRQTFDAVQLRGATTVAEAAARRGVPLVHVSAIGADAESEADYGRTKGEAEQALRALVPDAVVMRPSLIFGPEDQFFNRFAAMARLSPFIPVIGGGVTRIQPVYVGDVAEALARAVDGQARPGTTYELGGPEVMTFREAMERMLRAADRSRLIASIPFPMAKLMGKLTGWLPGAPITLDQVRMLERDNVVSQAARAEGRDLNALGIVPTALDVVLPSQMVRFRPQGQFTRKGEV